MADNLVKLMDETGYRQLINMLISIKSSQQENVDKCISVWQPKTVYQKDKVVLVVNDDTYSEYVCKATHESGETFDETYWTLVSCVNLEGYVEEDNIVTTLDGTVTDEQIPSAKLVKEKLNEVFQYSNDAQNEYETAIIGKGGTVSKASNVATKREILDGIESISVGEGEDIAPIHDTMTDLGYNATNLTNLSVDKTAHIISKWFILKSTTDNVDTILDVANTDDTDTFTDWITDDEITDFGDYINPTYLATQLTVSEDTTSGMFVSEELTVDELCAVNEGEVN